MTLTEYMDPERFPHTTQPGLNPADQIFLDAVNYDDLAADRAAGKPPTHPDAIATAAELDAKRAAQTEVMAEMSALPGRGNDPWPPE